MPDRELITKIDLRSKFELLTEHWRPKVIADLNGQELKIVRVKGEFPFHRHENADELFMVWKGCLRVEFRDHVVELHPGQCVVVPRGVEHRTCAEEDAEVLCFEPSAVVNTGDAPASEFTAPTGARI
jgi:mannose-6-phosphate isomerase-like protein (cupin superfamily)